MRRALEMLAIMVCLGPCGAQAATCLNTRDIAGSDSPDGKVLVITLKNGVVWAGALRGSCPDIRFNGFSWEVAGGQVCENMQSIRVLRSGQICTLGKLSPQAKGKPGHGTVEKR